MTDEKTNSDVLALIQRLQLSPHPEGGYYRETFRSSHAVRPDDARGSRPALTVIHFLLAGGQHSRWHRVRSDEAWHFHSGDPLELFWVTEKGQLRLDLLGTMDDGGTPGAVVPGGCWQAARPTGAFALASCSVAPGFDFEDFEMAEPGSAAHAELVAVAGLPVGLF